MLVTCKNCNASYAVPNDKIGVDGRNVRCAKCANVWYVEAEKLPDDIEISIAATIENLKVNIDEPNHNPYFSARDDSSVPAIIEKDISLIQKFMPVVLMIAIIATGLIFFKHKLDSIAWINDLYKKYNFIQTYDSKLENVVISKKEEDHSESLYIKGYITNLVNHSITLPDMRITIINEKGDILLKEVLPGEGKQILKGEKYPINNVVRHLDPKAAELILDIGNKLELLVR